MPIGSRSMETSRATARARTRRCRRRPAAPARRGRSAGGPGGDCEHRGEPEERARGAGSVSRTLVMPLWVRITFDTVPLTANRAAAVVTIAYPSRGAAARPAALRGGRSPSRRQASDADAQRGGLT